MGKACVLPHFCVWWSLQMSSGSIIATKVTQHLQRLALCVIHALLH